VITIVATPLVGHGNCTWWSSQLTLVLERVFDGVLELVLVEVALRLLEGVLLGVGLFEGVTEDVGVCRASKV
jgi:hypothetical protein